MDRATHVLTVTTTDGETVGVPSHRPDMTTEQVARDVAHRLKGDVCLWGMLTENEAIIIPGHQINHVLVEPVTDEPTADETDQADQADQPADPAGESVYQTPDPADQPAPEAAPAPAQATPAETGMAAPVDTASAR